MIAGRIITGVGNGISTATVPSKLNYTLSTDGRERETKKYLAWNSEIVGSHNRSEPDVESYLLLCPTNPTPEAA
jgi:hypothetical protein